ncbi:Protein SOGA2 [Aphelenchoides besseyi]|nr:Protein SOGA2 [Aphelenchoides besseyi]
MMHYSNNLFMSLNDPWQYEVGTVMSSDGICTGFEPQNYLRDRCKRCFRLKSKHDPTTSPPSPAPQPHTMPLPASTSNDYISPASSMSNLSRTSREQRRSWRDPPNSDGLTSPDYETADNLTETSSVISFKSANSKLLSNAKSLESISSNMDDRSMVTACSGSSFDDQDDDRAITPTEISKHDASQLRSENARLREQVIKLKAERARWTQQRPKNGDSYVEDSSIIQTLEERLTEAESLINDYRDENATLKCELREFQNQPMNQKLRSTEDLCNELMKENENLKAEIQELGQEVEEMKDHYREEEIDEFRKLQNELDKTAKDCRVLQFKLRKAERKRDQLAYDNKILVVKLEEQRRAGVNAASEEETADVVEVDSDDALSVSNGAPSEAAVSVHSNNRIHELESKLRIAKEISVRLHSQLEAAEEERDKQEDEVFYYKEKLRELQAQNSWRDNRNRADQMAARRQSIELPADAEGIARELRDGLERENDLREQLRYTEEHLQRKTAQATELEIENEELMQKLARITDSSTRGKRPSMTRSASEGHAQIHLKLATTELENLAARCDELEHTNNSLTKKILELEIDTAKRLNAIDNGGEIDREGNFRLNVEIEKDIGRLMARIHDLEKRNSELQIQLRKKISSDACVVRDRMSFVELRKEKQKRKDLETELSEYKQLIAKSDNNKLIAMATKVELLTNQLNMAIERTNVLHEKGKKSSGKDSGSIADENYADQLKQHIEQLEKELAELKARETFRAQKPDLTNGNQQQMPTADEIEQCYTVLASVEAQTNRLVKQLEKLDNPQKEERRRSLSKETGATIVTDLASIMAELKVIKQVLEAHKGSYPSCRQHRMIVSTVNKKDEQLDSSKQEIAFYKKKNKELTNQVLQTEERWTVEIEKQTHEYVTQIRALESELNEVKTRLKEQIEVADAHMVTLEERDKLVEEQVMRINRLEMELNDRQKTIQELDKEHRAMREWMTKYRTLEALYDKEKMKFDAERSKIKSETATLKKRTDDAVNELERLREINERREAVWRDEKQQLERELNNLKKHNHTKLSGSEDEEESENEGIATERSLNSFRSLGNGTGTVVRAMNYRVTRVNDIGVPELKKQLAEQQKKNAKESLESEVARIQESFDREKESLNHRARQAEKIRSFEIDALQQKFTSRMNIMENTNKSLHTQLIQIRRDRDRTRDQMHDMEKKLEEERKTSENEQKKNAMLTIQTSELQKKTKELNAEIGRLRTELRLAIELYQTDKKLWTVERRHISKSASPQTGNGSDEERDTRRITSEALSAAEAVQKQFAEYQKFYTKEVGRLNSKIREMSNDMTTKETEFRRKATALGEQIKILEIDQRNLIQAKEMQLNAREVLQADQERLLQIVQQAEIQKLTRKYKITAIIDRLTTIQEPKEDTELAHIITQLMQIKEEDCQNAFTSNDLADLDANATVSPRSLNTRQPLGMLTTNQRSLSIESTNTLDSRFLDYTARSNSPVKRMVPYPDPPPNFMHNMDKIATYDRDGRLHYVPKALAEIMNRSFSSGEPPTKSTGTLTDDEPDAVIPHTRSGSAGTNILYKIRREELAKGTPPSVRTIAKAFESLDKPNRNPTKRSFFNIRKSRSVDTGDEPTTKSTNDSKLPVALNRNTTSMSQIEDLAGSPLTLTARSAMSASAYATMTRGGRNPFKNMGSKLVERVRRSLSRSGRQSRDRTPEAPLAINEETSPLEESKTPIGNSDDKSNAQESPPKPRLKTKKTNGTTTKTVQKKPTAV